MRFSSFLLAIVLGAFSVCVARAEPSEEFRAAYDKAFAHYKSKIDGGARYMRHGQECSPAEWPGYEGLPVERCVYIYRSGSPVSRRTSLVYGLFPTAEQLATWTANACSQVGVRKATWCAERLIWRVMHYNGAQFAIAGVVTEPASVVCYEGKASTTWCGRTFSCLNEEAKDQTINFPFANGVTVRTTEMRSSQAENFCRDQTIDELEAAAKASPTYAFRWARVAHINRDQYRSGGGEAEVDGLAFLDVSREATKEAYATGSYPLMNIWVRANMSSFE